MRPLRFLGSDHALAYVARGVLLGVAIFVPLKLVGVWP